MSKINRRVFAGCLAVAVLAIPVFGLILPYFLSHPDQGGIVSGCLLSGVFLCVLAIGVSVLVCRSVKENGAHSLKNLLNYLDHILRGKFMEEEEEKRLDEELTNLLGSEEQRMLFKDELRKISENETMRRQFSANVSHELKSPLTSINGYAEMIESGMVPLEDSQHFAGIIHREGVRLLNMINEIIQLSKIDTGYSDYDRREWFNLKEVVEKQVEVHLPFARPRGVDFIVQGDKGRLWGNQRLLTDVVSNLLSNAIKYSKAEGGHVKIETISNRETVTLLVEDNGIGIAPEDQERIFERFYVVDKARTRSSGTGLGLSLVKHTVLLHGGELHLKSKLGEGSCFEIILPKEGTPEV